MEPKSKYNRLHKESYFILIKQKIHWEEITIVNIYTLNIGAQFHKTTTTGHKSTDKPQYNNSMWLQYPTLTNR
jgi:hypothetical protein